VPPSMAMAQAANESGWGRSRFAKEANNLFGVWTWDPEHGLRPERRAEGASHFVRVFPDLRASVRNYLYTINIGSAYEPLRQRRAEFRDRGKGVSGIQLSQGLERYSERGAAYVEEIQGMIRSNGLDELGQPELREVEATRLLDSSDDEGEQ
ncbi:MAG: glucosaminidase domain-containing protein, partial [Ectothiorhodospiraceae bacterium]